MAQQPSNQAVQQQQAQQAALTALLVAGMAKVWPLIDLADLKATLPRYQVAVASLVHKYGQASASIASRFYQQERTAAGVAGKYVPRPADPAPMEQVQASIGWATKGLWTPVKAAEPSAEPAKRTVAVVVPDHVANAQTLAEGVAQKMVVDVGRNTLIEAIEADRRARGWAREAKPGACSFCALLSTRGAVYRTETTASFDAHDRCHCVPVPLFADHYEPPAHVREWQQLYRESTRGKSGAAARNAFRVALDARRTAPSTPAPEPALV